MAANNSQIPLFYVEQFSSNIQLKLQQEGSVLRDCLMLACWLPGVSGRPVRRSSRE
jgi:hypothetical protein